MAIIENRSTEIGDVLIIKTEVPIIGIVTLLSFVDNTDSENLNKYFEKTFRYSVDGINYSDFLTLTNQNIQNIQIESVDTFIIEYYYQRSGVDESGSLFFNSVTLEGEFEEIPCGESYEKSMFSDYFNCNNLCSLNWSINVLEKLYKKGIIADYIERNKNSNNLEDRDFIDYWRSVTHYFALFVCLARTFSQFYSNESILKEYLKQRNLFFCDNIDYQSLYYLMQNYYDEIRQRGTIQIIKEKGDFNSIGINCDESESISQSVSDSDINEIKYVYGELLRLICYDITDEFLFNLCKHEKLGWNISNSSPLYSGMSNQNGVNKAYEDTQDFIDLNLYPLLNSNNCNIITDQTKKVLHISNVQNRGSSGVGYLDFSKAIKVDPQLDYEITFVVRQDEDESVSQSDSLGIGKGNLTFGCFAFDVYGNIVSLRNIEDNTDKDFFFEKLSLQRKDKYIYIRGIVFNSYKYYEFSISQYYKQGDIVSYGGSYYKCIKSILNSNFPNITPINWILVPTNEIETNLKTNLNVGNNLKFKNNVNYIIPYIILDNENNVDGELYIWDLKIKPVSTPYSHGFIQSPNFIHIWLKNKNGEYSNLEIEQIMRRYLLPYDSTFKNIYLEQNEREEIVPDFGDFNEDFNPDFEVGDFFDVSPLLITEPITV